MDLTLTSSAFAEGQEIPRRHTCDGEDSSPPLAWTGVPEKTQSFVLIVDDPDAPDPAAPTRTWVHWVLFNIPPNVRTLADGIAPETLPLGTAVGVNDARETRYHGPCPPIGRHRYFHKLYALDTVLSPMPSASKSDVERAMAGHVLAEAQLKGTYVRPQG